MTSEICRLAAGVDLAGAAVRVAVGRTVDGDGARSRSRQGACVIEFLRAPEGELVSTGGPAEVSFYHAAGHRYGPLRTATDRAGYVIAQGDDAAGGARTSANGGRGGSIRGRMSSAIPATLAIDGGTPVRDSMLSFSPPMLGDEEIASVIETLRSGWLTSGPRTRELEERFAARVGTGHAIATSSCTAALHLAMVAAGLGEGDEVITTSFTWPATTNAVLHAGATPVFADVDADTLNIDPDAVRALVGPRTRAVLPVHFAGGPCDMDALVRDRARALAAGDRGCGARGRGDRRRPQGGIDRGLHVLLAVRDQEPGGRRGRSGHDQVRRRRRSSCGCCGRRASRAIRGGGSCRAASGTTT